MKGRYRQELDLLTKGKIELRKSLSPEKLVFSLEKMAIAIRFRFKAMAERRHSSVAARMPLFRIFEMQCSRFRTEKLPSAQILRSRIIDK